MYEIIGTFDWMEKMHSSNIIVDGSVALNALYSQLVKMTTESRLLQLHEVEGHLMAARKHILNRQESVLWTRTGLPLFRRFGLTSRTY